MLRRAENASVTFRARFFSKRGCVDFCVGSKMYTISRMVPSEFAALKRKQQSYPVEVAAVGERMYWHFQDRYYWENDGLNANQVHALLVTRQQREQSRVERAQAMVATGMRPQDQSRRRDVIPDDVKQLVWMWDGGRCKHCGAQSELQYDHIIPVATGGSSNPENLQILCGPCKST